MLGICFCFQAEDGIRDLVRSRGLGDVYKRQPLRSASVTALHVPSGTKYGAIVRADGRFNILGMRVGGPYTVTASFTGFEKKSFENVKIQLGNTCLLYTSDAADERSSVDLGGRRIIKKKK